MPVEQRDIVVSAQAAGAIQPDTTVEVKSKASGEILQLSAETGQLVKRGAPLVRIDPRNARNTLAQAQADLDVAQAKLTNATSQKRRADELFKSQSITEQEHEQALLDYADASAEVVRSRVSVDNARIQLEDTDVRAPITGTIIEKDVERGTVIASATSNVSGGTTLLKMADLNLVQVRTLVDETDIGKIQPGQQATDHRGRVPQPAVRRHGAQDRAAGADRAERHRVPRAGPDRQPGGSAPAGDEHRGRGPRRPPRARARGAQRGAPDPARRRLGGAGARPVGRRRCSSSSRRQRRARRASSRRRVAPDDRRRGAGADSTRRAAAGIPPRRMRPDSHAPDAAATPPGPGGASSAGRPAPGARTRGTNAGGGRYIVFAKRNGGPTPVWIRTGLTDLDYSEVIDGLQPGDSVYVLPSASLVQSQQDMRQRMNQITGGGAVPGMQQQQPNAGARTGGGRRRRGAAGRRSHAARRDASPSPSRPSGRTRCGRCSPCWASSSAWAR